MESWITANRIQAVLVLFGYSALLTEAVYCAFTRNGKYSALFVLSSLSIIVPHIWLSLAMRTHVAIPALRATDHAWVAGFDLGSPGTWLLCFLVVDFFYYWEHRLLHMRWLWPFHHVHHSAEVMVMLVAPRFSPLEVFFRWIFLVPLVVLGFPLLMVLACRGVLRAYQLLIHTEYSPDALLRPAERLLVTPSLHRVHHARDPRLHRGNFGGVLSVWDRLFGTLHREVAPVRYGVSPRMPTFNPFVIVLGPFRSLFEGAKAPRDA